MMPISSTAPIRALRPGLAKNATMICLYSTNRISEHSTRNTSIRTRKIRGDDSLVSSISIAERVVGAIWQESGSGEGTVSGLNMAQRRRDNRLRSGCFSRFREPRRATGLNYLLGYFQNHLPLQLLNWI